MQEVTVKIKDPASKYQIRIGNGLLRHVGAWARESLGGSCPRISLVSNKKVFGLYGSAVVTSLEDAGFSVSIQLIGDGERFKSLRTTEKLLKGFSSSQIDRDDAVVALGGGVVGDAAGFAASVHLRGVRLLQIPTTLLSMIDSSVGGKTGVNSDFGKNLIGTFHQPAGVLIDPIVLHTLGRREITAGLAEAVKHGALAGGRLFDHTLKILEAIELTGTDTINALEFERFIAAQIEFKAKIVAGDEREATGKSDARSRKILNFGHTFAHALEKATDYRYLKHGEAVGYGILFAAEFSKKLELLPPNELNLLYDVVHRVGALPPINDIDRDSVLTAMRQDKKAYGNDVQWILLNGIGKPCIVARSKIPHRTFQSVLRKFLPKK